MYSSSDSFDMYSLSAYQENGHLCKAAWAGKEGSKNIFAVLEVKEEICYVCYKHRIYKFLSQCCQCFKKA